MRHFVRTTLVAASLAATFALIQSALADEVIVKEKVTTTTPSGVVIVENPASRSFKLQGHTETYVAPADIDLQGLSGKEVTVTLNPDGSVTKVERKTTKID